MVGKSSTRGSTSQGKSAMESAVPKLTRNPELLQEHIQRHRKSQQRSRPRLPPGLKTAPPYGTVQDIWIAYQDAADPRKVLDQLRNRERYPWKVLAFEQQPRPPYCGEHILQYQCFSLRNNRDIHQEVCLRWSSYLVQAGSDNRLLSRLG